MLKICLIEACDNQSAGSIGAFYVKYHSELAGHYVDVLRNTKSGYDVEMISLHHCNDFLKLAAMEKKASIRLVGGHPMQNNPRPIIKYADAVFIGEAESHIGNALNLIEKEKDIKCLRGIPGWIVSQDWKDGDKIPEVQYEKTLPDNPPYLNRPNTLSSAWYVEIARGCPYSCYYCELGNSIKYRRYSKERIFKTLDKINTGFAKKINLYAPDEASHPDYKEIYEYLNKKGLISSFSSMRLESVMKNNPPVKTNSLIRIGVDGLTEETRKKVNKPISNKMLYEYFKKWCDDGHINFKMFMMFGYSWESIDDFKEFEYTMQDIFRIPLKKNVMLRIKWTPFIPQPCTPLKNDNAKYDYDMVDKINIWHALNARPRSEPGFWVTNDGLMMEKSYKQQIDLTIGDENVLKKYNIGSGPLW